MTLRQYNVWICEPCWDEQAGWNRKPDIETPLLEGWHTEPKPDKRCYACGFPLVARHCRVQRNIADVDVDLRCLQ